MQDNENMGFSNETMGKLWGATETYGNTMMSWANAEFGIGFIILHLSTNKDIRKKLENLDEKHTPYATVIIDELKKCAREAYGRFILEYGAQLKELEDKWEHPGEYSEKDFDKFIIDLDAARNSRNALAHDITKELAKHLVKSMDNNASWKTLQINHINFMHDFVGNHMCVISKVAPLVAAFAHWVGASYSKPL